MAKVKIKVLILVAGLMGVFAGDPETVHAFPAYNVYVGKVCKVNYWPSWVEGAVKRNYVQVYLSTTGDCNVGFLGAGSFYGVGSVGGLALDPNYILDQSKILGILGMAEHARVSGGTCTLYVQTVPSITQAMAISCAN